MFINSKERLETVLTAQQEFSELRGLPVPEEFYRSKISECWARAQAAPAYRDLGRYSWEAFTALPPTTKDRLKADPWDFVAAPLAQSAKYYETTGTTGRPTPTPRLVQDIVWNAVSVANAWGDVIGPEDRVLSLLPSDVVPVGDLVVSVCEYLDVPVARGYPFATGISDWDRVASLIASFEPTVLFLAPGVALQATGLYLKRGHLKDLSRSVRSMMLLGEVCVPALRDRLGQWWGARAHDASYGSTETGTLAATCGAGRLHLLTGANYFEIADDAGLRPLTGQDTGRLVVTPLNLYARPLLRFDTGDQVSISDSCDCERGTPVVTVHGRSTDGLAIAGTVLSPRLVEEIVYSQTPALGYLVETDRDGGRFRLLLERSPDADRDAEPATTAAVLEAFVDRTGLLCDQVLFVNTLPSISKSGGSLKSWKRSNIRVVDQW
ncbi:MAG: phenylacetate--CoA ligase family protein [Catenulispora sp.]